MSWYPQLTCLNQTFVTAHVEEFRLHRSSTEKRNKIHHSLSHRSKAQTRLQNCVLLRNKWNQMIL